MPARVLETSVRPMPKSGRRPELLSRERSVDEAGLQEVRQNLLVGLA